ncbi:hypothetical protein D3C76_1210040 [compost metagenome]
MYWSINAMSTVAYTSSGERSIRIEFTDLIASVSSMPDCSSCSRMFSAVLLSSRARSPLPMPSLIATANVPLPSSLALKLSPESMSPPFAVPATPVVISKALAEPKVTVDRPSLPPCSVSFITAICSPNISDRSGAMIFRHSSKPRVYACTISISTLP